MNTTESTFQEYSMYYDTPIRIEGQCTQIGRAYFTEDLWLPILEETDADRKRRAEYDPDKNRRDGEEVRRMAESMDERCNEAHYANTQYRRYGRV